MKQPTRWMNWSLFAAVGCMPTTMALADEKPQREPQVIILADEADVKPANPNVRPPPVEFKLAIKQELGSYLGVSASSPPAVLRKQVGLSPGMGLVVEFVVPDSPAAKSGLQQFDILKKLDDQLLVNREQLAVLVRTHKPGDEVKLDIIREGKSLTLTARLIEHELEPLEAVGVDWNMEVLRAFPEPNVTLVAPGQSVPGAGWKYFPGAVSTRSKTLLEGDRSYSLTNNQEGHKTYTVKGKDGKIIFEGPVNNHEDLEKIPADLKEKLETLQKSMPDFRTNKRAGGAATQPARKKDADRD